MSTVTIHQAKKDLAKLVAQAQRGEEVLIARGKKVVAKIVPVSNPAQKLSVSNTPKKRHLAIMRGKFRVTSKFFEPVSADEL